MADLALSRPIAPPARSRSASLLQSRGFLGPPVFLPARPAFRQFDNIETAQAERSAHAFDPLPVSVDQLPFGAALETAHGQQAQSHEKALC